MDILIAGCGTGKHVFDIAEHNPKARILAVDISLASLAYARRKIREGRLRNIECAQADILKLGSVGRSFDHIEAVGVLHHLADPQAGWRVLLSLLRPNGTMHVALYSAIARRRIIEARALIASKGYQPTPDGIRSLRQELLRDEPRWKIITGVSHFYSMSGCRDLLFNFMEHRFAIPEIAEFLTEHSLQFLGFELPAEAITRFQQRFPQSGALLDLECWNRFEEDNPLTFRQMYHFNIKR